MDSQNRSTMQSDAGDQNSVGIRTEPWQKALVAAEKMLERVTAAPAAETATDDLAEAVIARGYARLYGGAVPSGQLPQVAFAPAAAALTKRIEAAEREAATLPVRWRQSGADAAEALVARLLQARMDGWAATEELVTAAEGSAASASTTAALEAFEDALDRFDRRLAGQVNMLAPIAGTGVLDEWRRQLTTEQKDPLPWWLDGRLESQAEAMARWVDRLGAQTESEGAGHSDESATIPLGHPVAAVRPVFVQEYAAAAAAGSQTEARQFRWRTAEGDFAAALIPPPERRAVPQSVVVEFTTSAGGPAAEFVGRVAFLRGMSAPIARADETSDAAVVARFPGEVVAAREGSDVLSLSLSGEPAWEPIVE